MRERLASIKGKIAKITGDFAMNIIASLIFTFARQMVVFPLLAAKMSDTDYGTLLTVAGLINVATAMIGNVLNNVRLIQNSRYEEKGLVGDFHWICTLGSAASIVYVVVLGMVFQISPLTTFLMCAYVVAECFYQYAVVHFRLNLDFKRNLIVNCVVSLTYVLLAFVCANATWWPVVFLGGAIVGLAYIAVTTRFYQEGIGRTPLLGETTGKMLTLVLGSLLGNLMLYADRVLIYPIIGAESVSYYSAASLFGKCAGMVMTPIAGVLLGYFSQRSFKATKKLFALLNGLSLLFAVVFLGACWLLAPWFTELLYPTLYEQAEPYLFLANLASVVGILGSLAQPMILRSCSTKLLLIIQIIHAAVYVVTAVWLMPLYGLWGFCMATILSNAARVLLMYIVGFIKF